MNAIVWGGIGIAVLLVVHDAWTVRRAGATSANLLRLGADAALVVALVAILRFSPTGAWVTIPLLLYVTLTSIRWVNAGVAASHRSESR